MRSLFTPALIAASLAVPFAVHAQTKLDPTEQALLGGMAHASSVSAPALSPVNAATTPYGASALQPPQNYNGNGANGFGGTLGNGSLTVDSTKTSDTDGNITFTFNPSGGFSKNTVVIYIDSKTGGIPDTSNLSDTGDSGRRAISGENVAGTSNDNGKASRTLVNFASGFGADYAISFDNTSYNNVFSLPNDSGILNYVTGQQANTGTNKADSVMVSYSQLGLMTPGQSFNFVATYLDGTSAYRSNETIGDSTTTVGDSGGNGNAGYTGTQTFTSYDTYTPDPLPAPEPSGTVPLLIGASALGGLIVKRRRAASATVTDTP